MKRDEFIKFVMKNFKRDDVIVFLFDDSTRGACEAEKVSVEKKTHVTAVGRHEFGRFVGSHDYEVKKCIKIEEE